MVARALKPQRSMQGSCLARQNSCKGRYMQAADSSLKISVRKKTTSWVVAKKIPQSGPRLIDKSEIAQGFSLLGVLGVLDQQHAIGPIHIALGRAHGLLNAFDLVAVALPYLGGVDACPQPTVPISHARAATAGAHAL